MTQTADPQVAREPSPAAPPPPRDADSERRFRFLAEALPQQVWTALPDGRLDYVNGRVLAYFGRTFAQMIGDGWRDVVHPDDVPECVARWSHSLQTGEPYAFEFRLRRAHDGAWRWHMTRADAMLDAAGNVVQWFGVNTDITDHKEAEEALARANETLERRVGERTAELEVLNERLQVSNRELQDFASVASHDLQEPLRKIQAFGDRLVRAAGPKLDGDALDYLNRMHGAAGRMRTLIEDLLAFSRVTTKAQPFEPVDLNLVASDVVSDLEARVQQTGARVLLDPLPTIEADPTQMRQLLQNLIANAMKFRDPRVGPVVRVGFTAVKRPGGGGGGDAVELYVEDNGIGFDERYLDRIFNVFQRLHGRGQYEGTGIGLAVCRKIVERHGGSITARSRPGEGATFLITLPVRHHVTVAGPPGAATPGSGG